MTDYLIEDWEKGDKAGLVSIGTHKLYLSVSGPDRKEGEPVVLLMHGLGSTISEWVLVREEVVPFARWVEYDRSGMGRSESPVQIPELISAKSVAAELDVLLKVSEIAPPFVLVCHSWGGFTGRELLHLRPNDVVGMVLVDPVTEFQFDKGSWGIFSTFAPMVRDLDWIEASGLATTHVLSDEQWKAVRDDQNQTRHEETEAAEMRGARDDAPGLICKCQLENQALRAHPLSLMVADHPADFQKMYDAGVAAGNGTQEEREICRHYLSRWKEKDEEWRKPLLKLSSFNRYVRVTCGHNVHLVQPEKVMGEIRWVVENWK
ncbi:hypothetical protein N7520_004324 [Penicillium odoratum]|uniref:uncharacterized protein n=1 Tax=Penicillium odoratum TaxID=1167516 RepID=UPI002547FF18|nr:uncharacterized protein N7520_004324 [Penicillium odoratum]KAJ5764765.1 hypothetical protein N7520_004324 [Penicillium odoratum]